MKKLFTLLLMFISIIALSGCKDPVIEETPIIDQVKESLAVDDVLGEITLPTEIDGVTITWQSGKPNLITADGEIIKPAVDTTTSLTAVLEYEDKVITKVFNVLILGDVSVDYDFVQTNIATFSFIETELVEDIDLITSISGITVSWESSNEQYLSSTGVVTRPVADAGNATVTLTATFTFNDVEIEEDYTFTVIDLTQTVVYVGYYEGAEDLSGDLLKAFLHDLIDDHTVISYAALWDALSVSDKDPNNPNNVILFYSGISRSNLEHGGNVGDWNREHVWARSHGELDDFISDSDMHHVRPTDVSMNGWRASLDFDNGGVEVLLNGVGTDNYKDGDSWEPRDEVKGDVARMLFYMAVRYEGEDPSLDLELNDTVNGSVPYIGRLSILLLWHLEDLPDAFEMNRNDVIETYQGNRNPFIDHPEFAELIWG